MNEAEWTEDMVGQEAREHTDPDREPADPIEDDYLEYYGERDASIRSDIRGAGRGIPGHARL
jgi:hypothetical protein